MIRRVAFILSLAALSGCTEEPAGEPVVRTALSSGGSETGAQSADGDTAQPAPGGSPEDGSADGSLTAATASLCRKVTFEETPLTHCVADPARHTLSTVLSPDGGQPFGSLSAYAKTVEADTIALAVNAGAFGDDLRPLGYYVESGERRALLNQADGSGNFFLKPNGVLFGSESKWQILTTQDFLAKVRDRPRFGTQSGPMLVIKGVLHPQFQEDGPSRAIRHGVGLGADGTAHFVISDAPLSFGKFARFFKNRLGTPNAIALGGPVTALWDPASGRLDDKRVGPLLVVKKRLEQASAAP
ncbi:MAG: phosphodiester glycosidase family protein [Pseudomonadota bacterium]